MAYYNTFIWTIVILVMVGLSRAVPTDTETESSEGNLKDEFNYVQALNRGSFASDKIDIEEFGKFYNVKDILLTTIRELDCNLTYDMLVFMKVMTPENYKNEELCNSVDKACPNWAQHMLNARINSGFPLRECPYTSWIFYLYVKGMQSMAVLGKTNEMIILHGHIETHLKDQMKQQCANVWPRNRQYGAYVDELNSLDQISAFEKLTESCAHLSKLNIVDSNLDSSLYINNVTDNHDIINNLLKVFGDVASRFRVMSKLDRTMYLAKNRIQETSLLCDSIRFLERVHYYFMQMLKTIMLRICWICLNDLKSLNNDKVAEQVQLLLYNQHLNDFANLLKLKKDDDLMVLIADSSHSSVTVKKRMSMIMSLLEKYNKEEDAIIFEDQSPAALKTLGERTYVILDIASGFDYYIETPSSIRVIILRAEVFVGYLKNILDGVNFNTLQSFGEFNRLVREKEFVW